MCCRPWGRKESDTTERLNSSEPNLKSLNRDLGRDMHTCSHEATQADSSTHTPKTTGTWPSPASSRHFFQGSQPQSRAPTAIVPEAFSHCQPVKCSHVGPAVLHLASGSCTCVPSL